MIEDIINSFSLKDLKNHREHLSNKFLELSSKEFKVYTFIYFNRIPIVLGQCIYEKGVRDSSKMHDACIHSSSHMAEKINISRVSVSKAISSLKKKGLIFSYRSNFEVRDESGHAHLGTWSMLTLEDWRVIYAYASFKSRKRYLDIRIIEVSK